MSQFDVHINPSRSGREDRPYVLIVQTRFLDHLPTRLCAPLIREGATMPEKRLNPALRVEGRNCYFSATEIITVPVRVLGKPVANLEGHRERIIDALDFVVLGISDMTQYWFRPKQKGIGAGVPISWKGWALFIAYVGSILAVPSALQLVIGYEGTVPLRLACVAGISVPFLFLAWKKTEGGWRWRHRAEDVDDETRG